MRGYKLFCLRFMTGSLPNPLWGYRIAHYENLDFILREDLFTTNHPDFDPKYVNIKINPLQNNEPV